MSDSARHWKGERNDNPNVNLEIEFSTGLHILIHFYLKVTKLRKCVDNDTKNDVQTNGGDEDEERHVVQNQRPKRGKGTIFTILF